MFLDLLFLLNILFYGVLASKSPEIFDSNKNGDITLAVSPSFTKQG